jgi:phage terminase large subunit GpA-like protein
MVREFLQAKKLPETLRVFVKRYPWRDMGGTRREVAEMEIADHRENWGDKIPDGVVILTAGADVQDDRLELLKSSVTLVTKKPSSVAYHTLYGDPASAAVWNDLDGILLLEYQTYDGMKPWR